MTELEEDTEVEQEEGVAEQDNAVFLYAMTSQTPWWIVSVLLHALVIVLAGLASMSIDLGQEDEAVVMVTELAPRPEIKDIVEKPKPLSELVLQTKHDTPPTDPTSKDPSDIVVPPDILEKAEIGDHWETINPDRPDTQSAFGNPDAHMFHSVRGNDDAAGGGGMGGNSLEDLIGVGGGASPGSGGGWGGGHGTGTGVDNGSGHGSFGSRTGGGRRLMIKRHGGSRATEGSVDLALRWLAYHQETDGHWDGKKYSAEVKTDTAITGFALLAFLGAGHTEKVGEYRGNVQRAVAWLKSKQDAEGMIWDTSDDGAHHRAKGYPCAIATLAIAEAAGMANIPDTKAAAQKAINYCTERHQAGEGSDKGAWRYGPREAADLSVSGWFTMALKSAKVAGLHVNAASFDGMIKFLDAVEKKDADAKASYGIPSHYEYMPGQPHDNSAHRLTMIGNLARQFMGWKKEDLQGSVEWAMNKGGVPSWGANGETADLYYWYYGTLCVFQQGGDLWKRWNAGMMPALVNNQCKQGDDAGSWNPVGDFSTEWGRVGQTALGALCLEVYYRYAQLN